MPRLNLDIAVRTIGDKAAISAFAGVGSGADKAGGQVRRLDKDLDHLAKVSVHVSGVLRSMGGAIVGALAGITIGAALRKIVTDTSEAQKAFSQLEAGVRSTGGAAGFSATQLAGMASQLQLLSTFEDEAIEQAQALLLTFQNVRGDTFKEATKAIIDMATRMDGDLKGAAIQVGKALQDPVKGMTALGKAGVSFSASQKELVKDLVASGRGLEAQKIILQELQNEFGGSAKALRDTLPGSIHVLMVSIGELAESVGAGLTPALRQISERVAQAFSSGELKGKAEELGRIIGDALVAGANAVVILAEALSHLPAIMNEVLDVAIALGAAFAAWGLVSLAQVVLTFNGAMSALAVGLWGVEGAVNGLSAAWARLNAYLLANPLVVVAAAFATLVYSIRKVQAATEASQHTLEASRASFKETAAAVEILKNAKSRLTDETHRLIGAQLGELRTKKALADAEVSKYEAFNEHPVPEIAPVMRERLAAAKETAKNLGLQLVSLNDQVLKYVNGAWKAEDATGKLAFNFGEAGGAAKKLEDYLQTLDDLQRSLHQKMRVVTFFIKGGDLAGLAKLTRAQQLQNYYEEMALKFGKARAAQLVDRKRLEFEYADAIERHIELLKEMAKAQADLDAYRKDKINAEFEKNVAYFTARFELDVKSAEVDPKMVEQTVEAQREPWRRLAEELRASLETPRASLGAFQKSLEFLSTTVDKSGETYLTAAEAQELYNREVARFVADTIASIGSLASALSALGGGSLGQHGAMKSLQQGLQEIQNVYQVYEQTKQVAGKFTDNAALVSSLGYMAGTLAAFYVIFDAVDKMIKGKKAKRYGTVAEIGVVNDEFGISAFNENALAIVKSVKAALKNLFDAIDAFGANLPDISIKVRNDGKKVEAKVAGELIGYFSSVEEAVSAAVTAALKQGSFKGISAEVAAVLKNTIARDMEELGKELELAIRVSRYGIDKAALQVRDIFEQMMEEIAEGTRLRFDPSSIAKIFANGFGDIQAIIDDLTGKKRSEAAQRMDTARAIKAELDARRASIMAQVAEMKVKIEAARATLVMTATLAAAVKGLEAQIANLLEIYKQIPDIDLGKVTKGGNGGKGGGATRNTAGDFARDLARSRLGEFASALADLQDRYKEATTGMRSHDEALRKAAKRRDEAIKAANGNADAIKKANQEYHKAVDAANKDQNALQEANRAREEEIRLLGIRALQTLIDPYSGGPGVPSAAASDFASQMAAILKAYEDLRTVQEEMGITLGAVNGAERERLRLLGLEGQASLGIRSAQIALQVKGLADTLQWLYENFEQLGLTMEDMAATAAEVSRGMAMEAIGSIERYITDEKTLRQLAEMRYDIDKANAKLQLTTALAMGVVLQKDYEWAMGIIGGLSDDLPVGDSKSATMSALAEKQANRQAEIANSMKSAADALRNAVESLQEWARSLLLDKNLSALNPTEMFSAALGDWERTRAAALSGGTSAAEAILNYQKIARDFLEQARDYNPAKYEEYFRQVLADIARFAQSSGAGAPAGPSGSGGSGGTGTPSGPGVPTSNGGWFNLAPLAAMMGTQVSILQSADRRLETICGQMAASVTELRGVRDELSSIRRTGWTR